MRTMVAAPLVLAFGTDVVRGSACNDPIAIGHAFNPDTLELHNDLFSKCLGHIAFTKLDVRDAVATFEPRKLVAVNRFLTHAAPRLRLQARQ
jgi:hypothetical protein